MVGGTGNFSLTSDTQVTIDYTVNGNPVSDQLTIFGQIQYTFNTIVYLPNCIETDVEVFVNEISGSADYSWSLGPPGNPSDPLGVGSYTVTIDDNSVCTPSPNPVVLNFDVLPWPGISANIINLTEPIPCPQGSLFGEVVINPVGGTGTVDVIWTPLTGDGEEGANPYHYLLFEAGSYQIEFEDELNCTDVDVIIVSWDAPLTFTLDLININHIITSQGNVICEGEIEVVVLGSSEDFIFTIDPDEGVYNYGNDTFEGIEIPDFYDVTATVDLPNSYGCSVTDNYEVESNPWNLEIYDHDGDGDIDFTDYQFFLSVYNSTCPCAYGDFNNDGFINFTDLSMINAVYPASVSCP
jgi:hypothetical protein